MDVFRFPLRGVWRFRIKFAHPHRWPQSTPLNGWSPGHIARPGSIRRSRDARGACPRGSRSRCVNRRRNVTLCVVSSRGQRGHSVRGASGKPRIRDAGARMRRVRTWPWATPLMPA